MVLSSARGGRVRSATGRHRADVEESGHATIFVVRDDGSQEETLRAFGTYGTNQATLRRRLRPYARLPTLPNLITARSLEEFSVNSYPVMARVSGPLDGWVVWLETTGIEDRAQRLHLMRPDGSGDRVLATRPAEVGPCTADGYWCEVNNRDPDADCTDAVLEAEGGLCSMPSSLYEVGSDPHFARAGSSMKVDAQAVMYSLVDAPLTTVTRTSAQPWPTTVPATSTCPSFVPWSRGMTA